MKKCDYCAKEITYFEQYCCEECERKTVRYHLFNERFSKLFLIVNTICVFGIPVGLAVTPIFTSMAMMILPFPTEGMIRKHKLKKAINISRIFGGAVMLLGVAILMLLIFVI